MDFDLRLPPAPLVKALTEALEQYPKAEADLAELETWLRKRAYPAALLAYNDEGLRSLIFDGVSASLAWQFHERPDPTNVESWTLDRRVMYAQPSEQDHRNAIDAAWIMGGELRDDISAEYRADASRFQDGLWREFRAHPRAACQCVHWGLDWLRTNLPRFYRALGTVEMGGVVAGAKIGKVITMHAMSQFVDGNRKGGGAATKSQQGRRPTDADASPSADSDRQANKGGAATRRDRRSLSPSPDDETDMLATRGQTAADVRDKVFISYSHKDSKFLEELRAHLKPLIRDERMSVWSDKQIRPGAKWLREIKTALASAKVAVLLVTKDFLASDFIHEHELGPLLKEAQQGGVLILWVPVRACAYKETSLKDIEALTPPDKPLAQMKAERDGAWVRICEGIRDAIRQ